MITSITSNFIEKLLTKKRKDLYVTQRYSLHTPLMKLPNISTALNSGSDPKQFYKSPFQSSPQRTRLQTQASNLEIMTALSLIVDQLGFCSFRLTCIDLSIIIIITQSAHLIITNNRHRKPSHNFTYTIRRQSLRKKKDLLFMHPFHRESTP